MPSWDFEEVDAKRTGASGDAYRNFENTDIETPGVFSVDPPAGDAVLLVREFTQNSWDSALERHKALEGEKVVHLPQFELHYKFRKEVGQSKLDMIEALGLKQLRKRGDDVKDWSALRVNKNNCLEDISKNSVELQLLEVVEQGSGGMFGPWDGDKSRLWKAMCSYGVTTEETGRGGSYGFGKAGFIRGSHIRCVFAYTCFPKQNDDEVTRRILGCAYWRNHNVNKQPFTGMARFGNDFDPLVDEEADNLAEKLGLDKRSPKNASEIGTTWLLIDPAVHPEDVITASERYWWPAIVDDSIKFQIRVTDYNGFSQTPDPESLKELKPFIEAYKIATNGLAKQNHQTNHFHELGKIKNFKNSGTLGLVADLDDWSLPHEDKNMDFEHCTMIALLRKPRMVVKYYSPPREAKIPPFVRGTFVANDLVDEPLRLTEPIAHDNWQHKPSRKDIDEESKEIAEESKEIAKEIFAKVNKQITIFRQKISPTPKLSSSSVMPHLSKLFGNLFSNSGNGKPKPGSPPKFNISAGGKREAVGDTELRIVGVAKISFSDFFKNSTSYTGSVQIEVKVKYQVLEEGEAGGNIAIQIVQHPPGFSSAYGPADSSGELEIGQEIEFEYKSNTYDRDWAGDLIIEADIVPS